MCGITVANDGMYIISPLINHEFATSISLFQLSKVGSTVIVPNEFIAILVVTMGTTLSANA